MTEFAIFGGVDHRGTVGKVAPGLFAQERRCWRMIYANPVGQGAHCPEPVAWVGRWKFLKGWTKVWSCERHADELPWARRQQPYYSVVPSSGGGAGGGGGGADTAPPKVI